MRKALNENPMVQLGLLGGLGLIAALVFMMQSGGGAEPAPEPDPAASAAPVDATTGAAVGALPAVPGTAPPVTDPAAAAVPAPADSTAPAGGKFEASDGLPKPVVNAYDNGDVVVLLIQQNRGIEDKKLRKEVDSLRSRGDTSVFVVDSKRVADYSRIAEGVDLDRIPAIIVLEPKRQTEGRLPTATVHYGFRNQVSVEQAVRDALYDGKELPYHPG